MAAFGNLVWIQSASAQGGDQVLDGIGETSLVARFVLDGNAQDRSRDSHNATLHGSGATFVEDKQFGRALSLSGEDDAYVSLPAATLGEADTISVVGWVNLGANTPKQRLFDFGKNANASFYCMLTGADAKEGYRARITTSGATSEQGPAAAQFRPTAGCIWRSYSIPPIKR